MHRAAPLTRVLFGAAGAITAAAFADPLVEAVSNAGVFGPGPFTDGSNADVVPALAIGACFAALFVIVLARRALTVPRWIRAGIDAVSPRSALRMLPAIFAAQFAALYAMESAEQLCVHGRLLGGTIWLGGPAAFSVAVHVCAGILVTLLFASLLRRLAHALADVIRFVQQLVVAWPSPAPLLLTTPVAPRRRIDEPACDRRKGRAPPHLR